MFLIRFTWVLPSSQFLQIAVRGDLRDPQVLREIRHLGDEISLVPHVTQVIHVAQPIERVNEAMEGLLRLPDTRDKVGTLYGLILGQPSMAQLVTDQREEGLVHVRLDTSEPDDVEGVLARVESLLKARGLGSYTVDTVTGARADEVIDRIRNQVAAHFLALGHAAGISMEGVDAEDVVTALQGHMAPEVPVEVISEHLRGFLRSDEALVELPQPKDGFDPAAAVAREVAGLGPDPEEAALSGAIRSALSDEQAAPDRETVEDLAFAVGAPVREFWAKEMNARSASALLMRLELRPPEGASGQRFVADVAALLTDLDLDRAMLPSVGPASGELIYTLTGMPLLNRGLSQSVTSNQWRSLGLALVLVVLIMVLLFRSVPAGLLASTPTALTLLVIYGGMGLMGIHLDIGTSMLASLILGTGVDYAVHLMAAWRVPRSGTLADGAARAMTLTGPPIITNALAVAAGFFVLTLGEARPLQNVGGLTAAAMVAAALATFVAIPALARKTEYLGVVRDMEMLDGAGPTSSGPVDDPGSPALT